MAQDNLYEPNSTGTDQKVTADADRLDTTTVHRVGSTKAYPSLTWSDDSAMGALFNRLRSVFTGLDADGKRTGDLIVAPSSGLTNLFTNLIAFAEETTDLLEAVISTLGLSRSDVQNLINWLKANLDSIVNKNLVHIRDSVWDHEDYFELILSRLENIRQPLAQLSVLYYAYNYAVQAIQTIAVVGDPPRINGPATFINIAAANIANGTTQYVIPSALYARQGVQIYWTCVNTTTLQFNIYGKVDDAAWAAAGTIPAGYLINSWMQTTPGIAFGSPPIGGVGPNIIEARIQDPTRWNSFAVEMVASNSGGNSTVTGTYTLGGGTA